MSEQNVEYMDGDLQKRKGLIRAVEIRFTTANGFTTGSTLAARFPERPILFRVRNGELHPEAPEVQGDINGIRR